MNIAKMILLAAITGTLSSVSIHAIPLDITFVGGAPVTGPWPGISALADPGFQDVIQVANAPQVQTINLAGVNSITMTWSAPAGYMYVVNPPPAGLVHPSLYFETYFGSTGQASSLGSITASSTSVHTVFGTSPLVLSIAPPNSTLPGGPALGFAAVAEISANSAPFAFTTITISALFNGTGALQTLSKTAFDVQSSFFADYSGDFALNGPGTYDIPPNPGPLLTLEPLPTEQPPPIGSTPDSSSTLSLAGLGFVGLWLLGRKLSPR